MEATRPGVVLVEVAASVVEISADESDRLRRKLRNVGGFDSIVARFEEHAVVPVGFNLVERFRLRAAIEAWKRGGDLPAGIADLLAALERADPRSSTS